METAYSNIQTAQMPAPIHWGHFGAVLGVMVLLLGFSWMQKPDLFAFHKNAVLVDDANTPHYYAYQAPPAQPLVAGASTDQVPSVINEDGTVSPVDMGRVLGASTQDVQLSLSDVKVKTVPDSSQAINKYLGDFQSLENG